MMKYSKYNKKSVPIGTWKCSLPPILRKYDRPTIKHPTDQRTDRLSHREVTLPTNCNNRYLNKCQRQKHHK